MWKLFLFTPGEGRLAEKAFVSAEKALALDPTLDEARNQLALVYCHVGAFDGALRESRGWERYMAAL